MDENTKTIEPTSNPSISQTEESLTVQTEVQSEASEPAQNINSEIEVKSEPQAKPVVDISQEPIDPPQEPIQESTNAPTQELQESPKVVEEPVEIKEVVPVIEPAPIETKPTSSGSSISSSPKVEEAKQEEKPKISPEPKVESKVEPAAPNPSSLPPVVHSSPLEALGAVFVANMKRARELLVKARSAIQIRKNKKIEKVMTLFLKKEKVKNKDVREFMHITDETATVYLQALVKEGKIKREGKGGSVYYRKI